MKHIFLIIFLLVGCATPRPKGKTEAEVLYREAKELIDDSRYLMAIETLNTLRSKYPYSYYSTHAELLQADILFKQESYVEASAAYILFKDFHPKHKEVAYVMWQIGESFYNQLPSTSDRDLTPGHEATKYYRELIVRYPKSKYVKVARERIEECDLLIQEKQKYIADFYYKTKVYDAARFWYLDIIKNHKSETLRSYAMLRAVMSSYKLKDFKQCVSDAAKFEKHSSDKIKEEIKDYKKNCQGKVASLVKSGE